MRDAMLESRGSLFTESTIIMDKQSITLERIRRVLDAREFQVEYVGRQSESPSGYSRNYISTSLSHSHTNDL